MTISNDSETLFKILENFTELYNIEKKKIPLQLNLVEEISPNENAHSRILSQIFRVSENNLKSFFNYLGGEFENINTSGVKIECEKQRIDISIKTNNNDGIIIENKIQGAVDQDKQIERYIEKLENSGVKKDQIYVLYLTNNGGEPDENSLNSIKKKELCERYRSINYRDHILPWLKNHLLPTCHYKDKAMIGAIEQYINFLEIRFKTLDIYKDMNEKLEKLLTKEFELENKKLDEKLKIINGKVNEINELSISAERLQHNLQHVYLKRVFKNWEDKIPIKYKESIKSNYNNAGDYFFLSVQFKFNEKEFACSIGKDKIGDEQYYVGISVRGTKEETKYDEITQFCEENYPDKKNKSKRWYVWWEENFENVLKSFNEIIEKTTSLI